MQDDSTGRIVDALKGFLETAPPGAQLPSNRALVHEFSASPLTVQRAIQSLVRLGLVETRSGVGTFARTRLAPLAVDYGWQTSALGKRSSRHALPSTQRTGAPDAIAMHSGYPADALLPGRLVRAAIARAARSDAATKRSPAAGMPELQAWFAMQLAEGAPSAGLSPSARDVVILPGSQSGLSSILRALVGPGRPLLIESPTYWGAIVAAEQCGVVLEPVPAGVAGPHPDDLARTFARTGARAFYAQPSFANPTGASWSAERASAVLDVVREYGAFLVEDDWAHDLSIDTEVRPLAAADTEGRVIYLRSLTKSVSPSLRIGALIARGPARDRILADRVAESMYVSMLLQTTVLDVITQPGWGTHLRNLREQLRIRRDLLADSLATYAPTTHIDGRPHGGLNLWVRLPDGTDVERLVRECESRGVLVANGDEWFPAEPSGPYIRLNYAGPEPERFPEAARVIGHVLADPSGF
jgi:DNA-binding transcriptional MocR family regulator